MLAAATKYGHFHIRKLKWPDAKKITGHDYFYLCAIAWSNVLLTQQLCGQLIVQETADDLQVVRAGLCDGDEHEE